MTPLALLLGLLGAWLATSLTGVARRPLRRNVELRLEPFLARWRRRALEEEVPPCIRLLADSIDAGMTIPSAAARAGAGNGRAARGLARFAESCTRGLTVSEALQRLTAETNGDLWAPAAFTIELHFRQGGNLANSLREVANQLELRRAGRAGAESATAQARFTANVVCAMPLLALAALTVLAPSRFAAIGRSPAAMFLMATGLGLQAFCLLVIRRLSRA